MGRKRSEEALVRYSVLVPALVDAGLKQMQEDAGEKNLSDTVRRVLREAVAGSRWTKVELTPDLAQAVSLASTLSGMTTEQVVAHLLRQHLGEVIENLRASSERLKQALSTGDADEQKSRLKRIGGKA